MQTIPATTDHAVSIVKPSRSKAPSDATITMRIPARTREIIDTAAASLGKSRTEFMIDSARLHAIDVLLDQRVFNLEGEAAEAFAQALSEPIQPNQALRALMQRKAPWQP